MIIDDLAAFLVGQGLATLGSDIFLSDLPDAPDSAAVLRTYGGMPPANLPHSRTFARTLPSHEEPRVQIKVRDPDYQAAELRAYRFDWAFIGVVDTLLGTTAYKQISALQQPFDMGRDSQQRSQVGFNIACLREIVPQ